MTTVQSLMLSVCFGVSVGMFVGDVGFLIMYAIDNHKEKKRKRMKEQNGQ